LIKSLCEELIAVFFIHLNGKLVEIIVKKSFYKIGQMLNRNVALRTRIISLNHVLKILTIVMLILYKLVNWRGVM